MKGTVSLIDPEETLIVNVDAWARLQFERNARRHGIPPGPIKDVAAQMPETYICIAAYYALKRAGLVSTDYAAFEDRWAGIDIEDEEEDLTDPTQPGA